METASPHAASVESTTAAAESTTSTTTSGEGFLWNQAGSDEDERCQRSEYISKHGLPPYLGAVLVGAMPRVHVSAPGPSISRLMKPGLT